MKYDGLVDLIKKVMRDEGMRGFFKGIVPNIIKLAPAAGISWLVVEEAKSFMGINDGN